MKWVDIVSVVALLQLLFFSILVGRARGQYGVHAPAVTGHPVFERLYRVHMNTLEQMVLFLPALHLAARYWNPVWVAAAGCLYIIGRFVFWRAYVADPAKRGLGFGLGMLPVMGLLLATLYGAWCA